METIFYGTGIFSSKLELLFKYLKYEQINCHLDIGKIVRANTGEVGIEIAKSLNSKAKNFDYKKIAKSINLKLIKNNFANFSEARLSTEQNKFKIDYYENGMYLSYEFSITMQEIMFFYDWISGHSKNNLFKWYNESLINELVGKAVNPFVEIQIDIINKQIKSSYIDYEKELRIINDEFFIKKEEIESNTNLESFEIKNEFDKLRYNHFKKIDNAKIKYESKINLLNNEKTQLFENNSLN